jgi:hypothetical protein
MWGRRFPLQKTRGNARDSNSLHACARPSEKDLAHHRVTRRGLSHGDPHMPAEVPNQVRALAEAGDAPRVQHRLPPRVQRPHLLAPAPASPSPARTTRTGAHCRRSSSHPDRSLGCCTRRPQGRPSLQRSAVGRVLLSGPAPLPPGATRNRECLKQYVCLPYAGREHNDVRTLTPFERSM